MNVHDRRLLRRAACGLKQLPVNFNTVGRLVAYLLRHDELRCRKIMRNTISSNRYVFAGEALRRHHRRHRWTLRGRADVRDVFAVAGDERCPLESIAWSHDDGLRTIDRNL